MKMKNCRPAGLAKLALLVLLLTPGKLIGQDARISQATAKTPDGLLFSVWVNTQRPRYGQDIIVHFKVTNRSAKPIYLVHDNTSKLVIDRESIVIPRPLVLVGGHEGYDYSFTRVAVGKTYYGQLVISKNEYKETQEWRIDVGFGYVSDITGLNRQLGREEDPSPLKGLLSDRLETLRLCGIWVNVIDTSP